MVEGCEREFHLEKFHCMHSICMSCLEKEAHSHVVEKQQGTAVYGCLKCGEPIPREEMRSLLGGEYYDQLLEKNDKQLFGKFEMVVCPNEECGALFQLEGAGEVDL